MKMNLPRLHSRLCRLLRVPRNIPDRDEVSTTGLTSTPWAWMSSPLAAANVTRLHRVGIEDAEADDPSGLHIALGRQSQRDRAARLVVDQEKPGIAGDLDAA